MGRLGDEEYLPSVSKIIVSETNPYYTVADGMLYTKDMKTLVGCPPTLGVMELNMFVYSDISLAIDNTDIACFDRAGAMPVQQSAAEIYGITSGTTTYSFSFKGEIIHTGTINIGSVTES